MNHITKGQLDFLYLPKDRPELEQKTYNQSSIDNTVHSNKVFQKNLIEYPVEFITIFDNNLIILFSNSKDNSIIVYKTDQELNIIDKTEISLSIGFDSNINRSNPKRSIYRHRNYIIFICKYIYKIDLNSLQVDISEYQYVFNGGNIYKNFCIHTKNNCIYLPEMSLGNELQIAVINIKTLNLTKKILLKDRNNLSLYPPARAVWSAVKKDQLIVNIQFDHEVGYTVFIVLDVSKKQVPETYNYKIHPRFIDGSFHLYGKYIYLNNSSLKYNIDKNTFLATNNNILALKTPYGVEGYINTNNHYIYSIIYKNFYFLFNNDTIYIINIDKYPLMEYIDYKIILDTKLSNKIEVCITDDKIFIVDIVKDQQKLYVYDYSLIN